MSEEPDIDHIDPCDPEHIFTCWCGAVGKYDELFASDLDETCGGTGSLVCYCGGDQCVCHHHGETDCPGCEDCETDDDSYYDDDPDDERP